VGLGDQSLASCRNSLRTGPRLPSPLPAWRIVRPNYRARGPSNRRDCGQPAQVAHCRGYRRSKASLTAHTVLV